MVTNKNCHTVEAKKKKKDEGGKEEIQILESCQLTGSPKRHNAKIFNWKWKVLWMGGSVLYTEAAVVHVSEFKCLFIYIFLHLIFHIEKGDKKKKQTSATSTVS